LAASRFATATAAVAAAPAQHPVEESGAEALATEAEANDERSKQHVPFHLSNVSFAGNWGRGRFQLERSNPTTNRAQRGDMPHRCSQFVVQGDRPPGYVGHHPQFTQVICTRTVEPFHGPIASKRFPWCPVTCLKGTYSSLRDTYRIGWLMKLP
jgi:hypothetical protein